MKTPSLSTASRSSENYPPERGKSGSPSLTRRNKPVKRGMLRRRRTKEEEEEEELSFPSRMGKLLRRKKWGRRGSWRLMRKRIRSRNRPRSRLSWRRLPLLEATESRDILDK